MNGSKNIEAELPFVLFRPFLEAVEIICLAGLLTYFRIGRLPNFCQLTVDSWQLTVKLSTVHCYLSTPSSVAWVLPYPLWSLQQRDCPGFSPDSLLILSCEYRPGTMHAANIESFFGLSQRMPIFVRDYSILAWSVLCFNRSNTFSRKYSGNSLWNGKLDSKSNSFSTAEESSGLSIKLP